MNQCHLETLPLQQHRIFRRGGEVIDVSDGLEIDTDLMPGAHGGIEDLSHVAFSTKLADKPAAWFERFVDARRRNFRGFDPVQRGIGKNRIKRLHESHCCCILNFKFEIWKASLGFGDHRGGCIDAEDLSAGRRALDECGLVARVHDAGRDGRPPRFSYHPFAGGLWIELVHTSFKAELADWIADTLAGSG